jgi:4-amino-4-deoxy-L-arabinose transferase-like glycosyltransferase
MRAAAVRYGPVLGLTLLGALLRFPTLDGQSFWLDELVTASLLDRGLGDVLREVPRSEASPYVYYVVAWFWSSMFGLGEVGLRSLSALAGTATVPVAYGAGAVLVSRRAGLVAAALVATSPFLVWYSQEARSYALFALFGATSVLAFGLALRGDRRWLAGWCVVSALTVATHYFGLFLVGAEVVWLLVRLRPRLPAVLASVVPGATLLAHLPVLLDQRGNGEAVAGSSLAGRVAGIPKNLVVGYSFPVETAGSILAACLVFLGLLLAARLTTRERWGALVGGSLAATVVFVPIVLAVLGRDYVIARNTIVAVVPAAVCVGAGFASRRVGVAAAVVLCALCTAIAVVPAFDAAYGRTDWRGAAAAIGPAAGERAVVVTPYMSRSLWRPYLEGLDEPNGDSAVVSEVVVVGLATEGGYSAGHLEPPEVDTPKPIPGFRIATVERRPTFTLVRYEAEKPSRVAVETLAGLALRDEQPGIMLQRP